MPRGILLTPNKERALKRGKARGLSIYTFPSSSLNALCRRHCQIFKVIQFQTSLSLLKLKLRQLNSNINDAASIAMVPMEGNVISPSILLRGPNCLIQLSVSGLPWRDQLGCISANSSLGFQLIRLPSAQILIKCK